MFKFLRIEHRFRRDGATFIPLDKIALGGIALYPRLAAGESIDSEMLLNERIANHPDPGSEKGREEATNRLCGEVAQDMVELLNCLTEFGEFSEESTFQLVEDEDRWDEE